MLEYRHMLRIRVFIVVSIALITVASAGPVAAPKSAPDVSFQTADGRTVRLATYRGRIVLVDFWASWCAPCQRSFPALDALYRDFRSRGFEVLAVNLDEQRRNAEGFLSQHPTRVTVLFDPPAASPVAFDVKGMPSSFLIDRAGQIRFTHMGYSGNVDASYRKEITQLLQE